MRNTYGQVFNVATSDVNKLLAKGWILVKEGDIVTVKVMDIDGRGKIKLSMKEIKEEN